MRTDQVLFVKKLWYMDRVLGLNQSWISPWYIVLEKFKVHVKCEETFF